VRYSSSVQIYDNWSDRYYNFTTNVLGLFGANTDSKILCGSTVSSEFNGSDGMGYLCKSYLSDSCTAYVQWSDVIRDGNLSNCSASAKEIDVSQGEVGHGGNHPIFGVVGPFKNADSGDILEVETDGVNNPSIAWSLKSHV